MRFTRLYLTAAITVLSLSSAYAQRMATYALKVTNAPYTEITDGTPVPVEDTESDFKNLVIDGSGEAHYDEFTGKGFDIGFDFNYNGKKMRRFMISTDGYLLLGEEGATMSSSCPTNPFLIFDNDKDNNLIGIIPISEVYGIPETRLSYKLEGTAPERCLVVQYKDLVITDRFGWELNDTVQIQFRLYEATGNLSITCNGFQPGEEVSMNYMSMKIGILGDVGDRLMLTDFSSGNTTTDDRLISWSQTAYPADGTTYTFVAPLPCVTPATQPTGLTLYATTKKISGSFKPAEDADHYLVLATTDEALNDTPADGVAYSEGETIGNATVLAATENTTFGCGDILEGKTGYNVFVMSYNAKCSNGPVYYTTAPLTAAITTMGDAPKELNAVCKDANTLSISAAAADGEQVIVALSDTTSRMRAGRFIDYEGIFGTPAGICAAGDELAEGGRVLYVGPASEFEASDLLPGKMYFVKAWATDGKGSYSSEAVTVPVYTAAYLPWDGQIANMAINKAPAGWTWKGTFSAIRDGYLQGDMTADGENAAEMWIETPDIYMPERGTRLFADFSLKSGSSKFNFEEGDVLKIQVTDGTGYKDIAVYDKDNLPTPASGTSPYTWTFTDYAGSKARIRFYIQSAKSTTLILNAISAIAKPECDYPVDVKAENTADGKAVVTWEQQGNETAWEVSYKKSKDEEWGEPESVTAREFAMDNLDSYTAYDVRVRAVCSETSRSEWSETCTFTSKLYVPFLMTIEELVKEPEGWNTYTGVLADPTEMKNGYDFTYYSSTGSLYFSAYDENCNSWYVSPELTLDADTEYEMTFDITTSRRSSYRTPSTDNSISIVVAADGENFYSKDVVRTITYDEYKDEETDYSFTIPVKGYDGKVRLGIYVASETGVPLSFYINSIGLSEKVADSIGRPAVETTADAAETVAVYNAAGQRTDRLQKGINIVRRADGKTVKVMIK